MRNLLLKKEPYSMESHHKIFFFKHVPHRIESGKTYYTHYVGSLYIAHCILDDSLQDPSITGYVGGGSSLIQKHVFEYLHYYDESLFRPLYVEDVDTSFRAWRMGFPPIFSHHPLQSIIINLVLKIEKTPEYYIQKNVILLLLKNITSLRSLLLHCGNFFLEYISCAFNFQNYSWYSKELNRYC